MPDKRSRKRDGARPKRDDGEIGGEMTEEQKAAAGKRFFAMQMQRRLAESVKKLTEDFSGVMVVVTVTHERYGELQFTVGAGSYRDKVDAFMSRMAARDIAGTDKILKNAPRG